MLYICLIFRLRSATTVLLALTICEAHPGSHVYPTHQTISATHTRVYLSYMHPNFGFSAMYGIFSSYLPAVHFHPLADMYD